MTKIGMSCEGCSFENGLTCSIGILDNILEESTTYKIVDGHYQFDRICPHKNSIGLTEKESFKRSSLPVSFIIIDTELEKTKVLIEKVNSLFGDCSICVSTISNFKDLKKFADIHKRVFVIQSFTENKGEQIRDSFLKVNNGYSVIIESTEDVDEKHIKYLNDFVNRKMKRLGLISDSPMVINNVLFKYLKGNKAVSYENKLISLSEEQGVSSMVYTWREVNEAVNS